ncbi:GIY-YIG nuclease family protein [Caminicella sporogenes]|uniref:GIY-YIG nuclease family protein n=1 Tax=Caminicella sporogenes TaxID=166485 RepID=UPI00253FDB83|nr:GIY-YIG nuclease family protein [Caminicella sporogenes]WIF95090.1 GIY-YIG nuclease family protein [Caminicella sporogenes]
MEREYTIYSIAAPSGDCYIGYTSLPIKERWRHHIRRALKEKYKHPFYNAIREFGPENFNIKVLRKTKKFKEAKELEKKFIESAPSEFLFNLSPGGIDDASFGSKIFWERINADPSAREAYLKKLSETKKKNDWTDYEELSKKAQKWREENPKLAYKLSYRAIRIARKSNKSVKAREYVKPTKEQLMWKYKRSEMCRKNALKMWELRSEDERAEIGKKISKAQKERMKNIAILPDFKQEEWPYAKATVLRKIREGLNREEIIDDAIKNVKNKSSHWREVKEKLKRMGIYV